MAKKIQASIEIKIPFHDVDPLHVAWHGHYFKYLEAARCELLQQVNYDYPQMRESGYLWPIVECHMKYVRSVHYGQKIRVTAEVLEYENRLKIAYTIFDAITNERLSEGYTTQVAVDAVTQELQFVSPNIMQQKFDAA